MTDFAKTPCGLKTLCHNTVKICETTACNKTDSHRTVCHCENTFMKLCHSKKDTNFYHLESNFNHLKSIQAMTRSKRAGSTTRILAPRNLPNLGSVLASETDFPVAENEGDIDLIEDANDEQHAMNAMLASSSGAAASSSSVSRPPVPTKKSADAKWTPIQEEKLVAVVMAEKAYIKTEVTVQKKFEMVAAKLLLDRDFSLDTAFAAWEGVAGVSKEVQQVER